MADCTDCGQPMLPPGEPKRPNEYDHASGCPKAPLTVKEWQKRRRAIISSRAGCECPNAFDDGRIVPASQRCNKTWIRCNGVLRIQYAELDKLGPKPEEPSHQVSEEPSK